MVRQAHGQPFHEWAQTHDPTGLLVMELKPAPAFLVHAILVQGLSDQYIYIYI